MLFPHSLLFLQFILSLIPCYPFQFMYSFRDSRVSYRPCSFSLSPIFLLFPQLLHHSQDLSSFPLFMSVIHSLYPFTSFPQFLHHSWNSYIIPAILTSFLEFLHHSCNFYVIPAALLVIPAALLVIPAKAGIQYAGLFHSFLSFSYKEMCKIENLKFFNFMFGSFYFWIPAFAGMTRKDAGMTKGYENDNRS